MNRPTLHIPSDERHRQAALEKMIRRVAAKRILDAGLDVTASRMRAAAAVPRTVDYASPSYAVPSSN
jgi:hypothetical protein